MDSLAVSVKFDIPSIDLLARDPKSSSELKEMKALLDEASYKLKAGSATADDKAYAHALGRTLKSCLKTRSVAEKTVKTELDTNKLLREKAELSDLMRKDGLTAHDKERAGSLKTSIKDSLEMIAMAELLQKRTAGKKKISFLLDKNLEDARRARKLVVCFLVDCTSSMNSYIEGVKNSITSCANKYRHLYPESSLYFGFVGYRDFGDSPQYSCKDFTSSLPEFISFVEGVRSFGGGDTAEDVVGGLNQATSLSWDVSGSGTSRILVHIADAPAHGSEYNGGCDDKYASSPTPDGSSKDATPHLKVLKSTQVHYFFYRVNNSCDAMVAKFNEHLQTPSKRQDYITIQQLSDVAKLADTVLKTFSSSVLQTMSSARSDAHSNLASHMSSIAEGDEDSVSGATNISEPAEDKAHNASSIAWSSLASIPVKLTGCQPPRGLEALRCKTPCIYFQLMCPGVDGSTDCKWNCTPFAKGSCRWAHHAQIYSYRRSGWQDFVLKRFIGAGFHSKYQYQKSVEEASIARFLAMNYNERRPAGAKPIRFLDAYCLEMKHGAFAEYFSAEEALPPGVFSKFSNNAGDWCMSLWDRSLLEFAKYSYDATDGYMMVTDLQGVDTGTEFVLTDPAIICQDVDRYTGTNLGIKGLAANYEMVRKLLDAR
jgi:hypothetical protein